MEATDISGFLILKAVFSSRMYVHIYILRGHCVNMASASAFALLLRRLTHSQRYSIFEIAQMAGRISGHVKYGSKSMHGILITVY